jgi:hypothetical protein
MQSAHEAYPCQLSSAQPVLRIGACCPAFAILLPPDSTELTMGNPRTEKSAEAKGRELAAAVSADDSHDADPENESRNVDGAANAKGRDLAQDIPAQRAGKSGAKQGASEESESQEDREDAMAQPRRNAEK